MSGKTVIQTKEQNFVLNSKATKKDIKLRGHFERTINTY